MRPAARVIPSMAAVVAKSLPRRHTSTEMSELGLSKLGFQVGNRRDRQPAGEILTDVNRRLTVNRLHGGDERQAAGELPARFVWDAQRDRKRQIAPPNLTFQW